MEFNGIDAVVTGFSGQLYSGFLTREWKGEDLLYHFTFDGGFESITLYKVADKRGLCRGHACTKREMDR